MKQTKFLFILILFTQTLFAQNSIDSAAVDKKVFRHPDSLTKTTKLEIEKDRQTKTNNLYNLAVIDYNDGINRYEKFIIYKNQHFKPQKSDAEIQSMIDTVDIKLQDARNKLAQINSPDTNTANMIKQLIKSIDDAEVNVREQQDWLKIYFSKGKAGRRSMFYDRKINMFGIPVD